MNLVSQIGLAGLMAGLMMTAGGCQQRQAKPLPVEIRPVERIDIKPATPAGQGDSSAESSADASSLAAQSQRDVEAILNARANSRTPRGEAQAGLDDGSPAAPAPRRVVVWNDPKSQASAGDPQPNGINQPPLLRPKEGSQQQNTESHEQTADSSISATSLKPDRLKSLMVDLSRELYASGAYSNTPLRELMMIAAMSMIDPQRQLNPQAIPDLTEKERELLGKLQSFFADLGASLDGNADTEKAIVEAVAKLRETLVKQPTLRLATTAFCTRVGGFGDYTPFERYSFLAQSQQKAIVYLEIEDFTSELNQKGEYVTQLAQQLTIYSDRDGIPVWKEDWQTAVDVTKNKRQDFFTVQVITLPKALSVGKYQLKVRVRDEQSQAEAEASIAFEMVADPKLAASVPPGK